MIPTATSTMTVAVPAVMAATWRNADGPQAAPKPADASVTGPGVPISASTAGSIAANSSIAVRPAQVPRAV